MSWLFNWNEAAKHPRKTVAAMFLSGLVGGGLIGYFRFNHSLGWALTLGIAFALVLGRAGWTAVHDPARLAQLTSRGGGFRDVVSKATLRLMIPCRDSRCRDGRRARDALSECIRCRPCRLRRARLSGTPPFLALMMLPT